MLSKRKFLAYVFFASDGWPAPSQSDLTPFLTLGLPEMALLQTGDTRDRRASICVSRCVRFIGPDAGTTHVMPCLLPSRGLCKAFLSHVSSKQLNNSSRWNLEPACCKHSELVLASWSLIRLLASLTLLFSSLTNPQT